MVKLTVNLGGKHRDMLWLSYDEKLVQVQMGGKKGKNGESFEVDMNGLELTICDGKGLLVGMLDWMKMRPGARMDAAKTELFRIWYSSKGHQGSCYCEGGYGAKRLVLGSGKVNRWKPNIQYGLEDSRGAQASFWEIDFCSLQLQDVSIPGCFGSPVEWGVEECQRGWNTEPRVTFINGMKHMSANLDMVDSWCMLNKDRFLIIATPGSEVSSQLAHKFAMAPGPACCYSSNG